jgi:DNA-binding response OmpR family regulator
MQILLEISDSEINSTLKHYGNLIGVELIDKAENKANIHIFRQHQNQLHLTQDQTIIKQFNLPIQLNELGEYLLLTQQKLNSIENNLTTIADNVILDKITKKLLYLNYSPPKAIELTEKEFDMLCYIINSGSQGVDKFELLEKVWGYNPNVKSRTIETHLYRLRQKINDAGEIAPSIVVENGRCLIENY